MRRLVIAIDGPAGSGKSSTARLVAKTLGYRYLDTGAMYRAVALKMLERGIEPNDSKAIEELLRDVRIEQKEEGGKTLIFLDGRDVSDAIRTPEISLWVGPVSENPTVRQFLVALQREMGKKGGVVVEGRDIGTVVFPDAQLKIYLTADLNERARRRLRDLSAQGVGQTEDEVRQALAQRDERDSTRQHSPLQRVPDAVVVDTTDLTLEQQVEKIVDFARQREKSQKSKKDS
ncbi:MAG: (d)CMP kinase [bacterium]